MSVTADLTAADLADLPIFPLGTVLFPGGLLPLRVFEARYVDMTGDCMKRGKPFGVCLIREGSEVGAPAVPEEFGCLAHIVDWDMQDLGVLQIATHGGQRFRLTDRRVAANGLTRGSAELIEPEADMVLPERFAPCARLLQMIVLDRSQAVFAEPHRFDDAAWVGYRLSEVLPVPLAAKQKLLELQDTLSRLEILLRYLEQRGLAAAG
jgi:Lon protease-like protein